MRRYLRPLVPTVLSIGCFSYFSHREFLLRSAERCERREFEANSFHSQLCENLQTGDLILFNRPIYDGFPLKTPFVLLAKYLAGPFDHCGVIVRVENFPWLLESSWRGLSFRPLDRRILQSKAEEIVVRRIRHTRTPEGDARAHRLVEEILRSSATQSFWPSALAQARLAIFSGPSTELKHQKLGELLEYRSQFGLNAERLARISSSLSRCREENSSCGDLATKVQKLENRAKQMNYRIKEKQRDLQRQKSEGIWQPAPFPSAALCVRVLQALEILPERSPNEESAALRYSDRFAGISSSDLPDPSVFSPGDFLPPVFPPFVSAATEFDPPLFIKLKDRKLRFLTMGE